MEYDSTSQMSPPLGVIDSQGSNKTTADSQWRVPGVCNHPHLGGRVVQWTDG